MEISRVNSPFRSIGDPRFRLKEATMMDNPTRSFIRELSSENTTWYPRYRRAGRYMVR
jgi:hypothetical protein